MTSFDSLERKSQRHAIAVEILHQEDYDEPKKINRMILYLFFIGFLFVNLYEGILLTFVQETLDHPPKSYWQQTDYTTFNTAICYVLDAIFRIVIAFFMIYKSGEFFEAVKG